MLLYPSTLLLPSSLGEKEEKEDQTTVCLNLLPTMRTRMAFKDAPVSQLVSLQISDPSGLGAALGVAASVGCMHGLASMPI